MVDFSIDNLGMCVETRSNVLFSTSEGDFGYPHQYTDTRYFLDGEGPGHQSSLGYLARVQTTWNSKDDAGWHQRVISQNVYTYDLNGNRLTNTVSTQPLNTDGTPQVNQDGSPVLNSRTEQYGYDELSRLTSVNYGDGETQGYTFDPMGIGLEKPITSPGQKELRSTRRICFSAGRSAGRRTITRTTPTGTP
jgi:hypothetical protein